MRETVISAPVSDGERVSARLTGGGQTFDLYFRSYNHPVFDSADPFVVAFLLAAMRLGQPVVVEAPVSEGLVQSLDQAQAIFAGWVPSFRRVQISAPTETNHSPLGRGTGSFFSLGVDSFYTLLQNHEEISHLITVEGFDLADLDRDIWDRIALNVRTVADALGKEVIRLESNARDVDRAGVEWMWHHGAALGAAGLVMSHVCSRIFISATDTFDTLRPWGSHPLVDHLWGGRRVDYVHYGADRDRVSKIVVISDEELVFETLRVCPASDGHTYNCGRCAKCLCVMLVFDALGKLGCARTFPHYVDPKVVRDLDLMENPRYPGVLKLLKANGGDAEMIKAVTHAIRVSKLKQARIDAGYAVGKVARMVRGLVSPASVGALD